MSRSVQRYKLRKKKEDVTNSILFQSSLELNFNPLHAGRESEGHLSWYAAYCACHSSFIFENLRKGTWQGAGCHRGTSTKSTGSSSWCCSCRCGDAVAGDVVLLVVGWGSSIVDNVFSVLSLISHLYTFFAAISYVLLFFRSLLCCLQHHRMKILLSWSYSSCVLSSFLSIPGINSHISVKRQRLRGGARWRHVSKLSYFLPGAS